jgi:hypothetical protein
MVPLLASSLVRKAGQARILSSALKGAIVSVHQRYFYLVDFGPGVKPALHLVGKDGFCTCELEKDCPAVEAVRNHLKSGGGRAEVPPPGYYPAAPHDCPVCRAEFGREVPACFDPRLSSKHRGVGWQCSREGAAHYWLDQARAAARASVKKGLPAEPANAFPFPDGYDPQRVYPEQAG